MRPRHNTYSDGPRFVELLIIINIFPQHISQIFQLALGISITVSPIKTEGRILKLTVREVLGILATGPFFKYCISLQHTTFGAY